MTAWEKFEEFDARLKLQEMHDILQYYFDLPIEVIDFAEWDRGTSEKTYENLLFFASEYRDFEQLFDDPKFLEWYDIDEIAA